MKNISDFFIYIRNGGLSKGAEKIPMGQMGVSYNFLQKGKGAKTFSQDWNFFFRGQS